MERTDLPVQAVDSESILLAENKTSHTNELIRLSIAQEVVFTQCYLNPYHPSNPYLRVLVLLFLQTRELERKRTGTIITRTKLLSKHSVSLRSQKAVSGQLF